MLPKIETDPARIDAINVCSRPFRAQGPRIAAEKFAEKTVVHNYGHGGSGWSLSWGSAHEAVQLALQAGAKEIAVVGCGAIGLTTAVVAQRHGLKATIHAKECFPRVHSAHATGVWSPDSRVATAEHATPEFRARWEKLVRHSHAQFLQALDLPGEPVRWQEFWYLSDAPFAPGVHSEPGEPAYPDLRSEVVPDLEPESAVLHGDAHPFASAFAKRTRNLVFNIAAHSQRLLQQFRDSGGALVQREFASLQEILQLPESVIVNATGFGAQKLCGDESLVPVRGQTALLQAQPQARYSVYWQECGFNVISRGDGVLVQQQAPGDFGNADTTPDRDATLQTLQRIARMWR